jgi:hypothetical protein
MACRGILYIYLQLCLHRYLPLHLHLYLHLYLHLNSHYLAVSVSAFLAQRVQHYMHSPHQYIMGIHTCSVHVCCCTCQRAHVAVCAQDKVGRLEAELQGQVGRLQAEAEGQRARANGAQQQLAEQRRAAEELLRDNQLLKGQLSDLSEKLQQQVRGAGCHAVEWFFSHGWTVQRQQRLEYGWGVVALGVNATPVQVSGGW